MKNTNNPYNAPWSLDLYEFVAKDDPAYCEDDFTIRDCQGNDVFCMKKYANLLKHAPEMFKLIKQVGESTTEFRHKAQEMISEIEGKS